MPTEPQPLTLSDAARRAAEACDPEDVNDAIGDLLRRLEDRDEPIAGLARLDEQLAEIRAAASAGARVARGARRRALAAARREPEEVDGPGA